MSATTWRLWWPAATMMLCSLLSYLDRQTLAVLSPMMLTDLRWSAETYSQVISAFSIAYMVGNPVWGALLDRIGVRLGMAIAVAVWTVASGAHALLSGFLGFAAARALLGFGEGATFPGGLRTATDSLPPDKQARGIALAYSGGSLGAIVTPIVVTPIALAYGWRFAFAVTGIAGILWLVLWLTTVDFASFASQARTARVTLPDVRERRFWSLVSSYALGAMPLGPVLYLAPLYLSQVIGLTQSELGYVLWIPPLGWEVGYFFWGWLADRFATGDRRPAWLFVTLALLGTPTMALTRFASPAVVLAMLFWAMFVAAGFVLVSPRVSALAYPREQTAIVAGIGAGSWSALIAVVLPLLGGMFDAGDHETAFLIVGACPVLGVGLWWLLTPRLPRAGLGFEPGASR
jgi:ACS family hexuronate transporter-like MFS transporter